MKNSIQHNRNGFAGRFGARWGFTLIELLVVIVIIGIGTSFAVPSLKDTFIKESVRNARRTGMTQAARARGAAAARGCTAAIRFTNGYGGRMWVTACDSTGAGIDTVGNVEFMDDQVYMFASPDSILFEPTGMSSSGVWSYMYFYREGATSNWVWITPVGGTHWQ